MDVEEALSDWHTIDGTELPLQFHKQWTKLWIAYNDKVIKKDDYEKRAVEIAIAADAARGVSEGAGRVRATSDARVARPAGGTPQPATGAAQTGTEREGQDEDGLTPDEMAQQWDAAAQEAGLPVFAGLNNTKTGSENRVRSENRVTGPKTGSSLAITHFSHMVEPQRPSGFDPDIALSDARKIAQRA
ncbi:hypothetical protein [Aromatoleum anaerobium]|uniref:Uncharacterized protein n=1 Tax=Aromatoleum anaerobium TaxID=182180 RepID=A0ABX1PQ40_9RHOO|nr:hypothetical protein [Aromatoleum anaerobium]MCK0505852.1 hypothetical protein [Aromatoleum anaerobium]